MVEGVIETLQMDYHYSWQDYYKEMEETWQLYPLDFYQDYRELSERAVHTEHANQALLQENESYRKEVRRLIREIQGMSQTISWKITQPLRAAKRVVSGIRH